MPANGLGVQVAPQFPAQITEHTANVPVSLLVVNSSIGAQASGLVTVTDLTLVPACGDINPTCDGAADPAIFQVSSQGTGADGTACAGLAFDITVIAEATGRVRFTRTDGQPIVLGSPDATSDLDTCLINFTVTELSAPDIDSSLSDPGVQVNQVAFVAVRYADGNTRTATGVDMTTLIAPAVPAAPIATPVPARISLTG
jgi:hypothetical protein